MHGHKEDSAEEPRPSASVSTSFERASQEIERASQELAMAKSRRASVARQASGAVNDAAGCRKLSGQPSLNSRLVSGQDEDIVDVLRETQQHSNDPQAAAVRVGRESNGSLLGQNRVEQRQVAEAASLQPGRAGSAEGGRAPEQASARVVDLWAGEDGEDDWDDDLAQLLDSAAALRPAAAADTAEAPAMQQPLAGPSGRGAAAPAGSALYASARSPQVPDLSK